MNPIKSVAVSPSAAVPRITKRRLGQSWGLGRFLFLIVFTVGFGALGIWQVRRQYEVIANGYEIDRDLFEYRRLLERQKRLSLLLSAYKDPTALRLFAEEDLGMIAPGHEQELYIPDPADAERIVPTNTLAPKMPLLPQPPVEPPGVGHRPTTIEPPERSEEGETNMGGVGHRPTPIGGAP